MVGVNAQHRPTGEISQLSWPVQKIMKIKGQNVDNRSLLQEEDNPESDAIATAVGQRNSGDENKKQSQVVNVPWSWMIERLVAGCNAVE